jgi:hypothetical protein
MPALTRFAYDKSGSVIACADGRELLAYAGTDEHPMWKRTLGAAIVGLGTTPGEVIALDEEGRLERFEASSGTPLPGLALGAHALGLSVAREGTCAALLDGEVALVSSGRLAKRVPMPGATTVAMREDGGAVAIGTTQGKVQVIALHAGDAEGGADLGAEVGALCWNVKGLWVATSGDRLFQIAAGGGNARPITKIAGRKPEHVSCSADGGLLACRMDRSEVSVISLPEGQTVGTIGYPDRAVEGVAFGPDVWLGVGLDRGDGNKINLTTGACHRTDTHPGRPHNSWALSVQLDKERIKMGRSTANPSAAAVKAKLAEKAAAGPAGKSAAMIIVAAILIIGALIGAGIVASRCG